MIKYGQITKRDDAKGLVTVEFSRPEACAKCGACGSQSQKGEVVVPSNCEIGQWVRVELPENRFLQATVLVYVLPLAGLILGMLLGYWLSAGSDLWTVLAAAFGVALSLFLLHRIDRRMSQKPEWTPKITGVFKDKPTNEDIGCGIT
jgi:sigma-E factor negative regulatory protein RseC